MVFRVNLKNLIMEEVETFDNISIKDLVDGLSVSRCSGILVLTTEFRAELPENAPRFIVLSYGYEHKDGRKSFPLLLINWAPRTAQYGLLTLHASCSLSFEHEVRSSIQFEGPFAHPWFCDSLTSVFLCPSFPLHKARVSKVIEAREPDELTREIIDQKLSTY